MTALNIVRQKNAVHLVTDGAVIDANGRLVGRMQKTFSSPEMRLAFGVAGTPNLFNLALEAVLGALSYDDFLANAGQRLADMVVSSEQFFGRHELMETIGIIGWSKRSGPHAYLVATHTLIDWLPPYTPVEVPGMFYTPSDARLDADFGDLNLSLDDASAVALVTRQRSIIAPSVGNWSTPIVGCHVSLTSAHETGIETRILKRWRKDRVGSVISP
jgi:hypothetical protein